jgi:hypothetical protein
VPLGDKVQRNNDAAIRSPRRRAQEWVAARWLEAFIAHFGDDDMIVLTIYDPTRKRAD